MLRVGSRLGVKLRQDRVDMLIRELMQFLGRPVLYGMGQIDDRRREAEGVALRLRGILERRGDDVDTRYAESVEGSQVVQTARRARASIGQCNDGDIGLRHDALHDF